jgi:hypothetical protein
MNIELTAEQREAIAVAGKSPPRLVDPDTNITYVLVPEAAYERVQGLLADIDPREVYPAVDRAFAEG